MIQIVIIAVAFALWTGSIGYFSYEAGQNSEVAKQATKEDIINQVEAKAASGAASAIAGIQIKQVTINNKLQKEILTNTVYADCKHTDGGLRELNAALENKASASQPSGGGHVPSQTDKARGQ